MISFRHFAIRANDIHKSRRFYEEGLGVGRPRHAGARTCWQVLV